jgi:ribonuclease Z
MSGNGDFKVTLLGTGAPPPEAHRFGPSVLVEAGKLKLLFDAGRGVPVRLRQIGVPMGQIDRLFMTHYHSDHTVGIPDLWLTGWLNWPWGKRTTPFHTIGPTGLKALMDGLWAAYQGDINIRLSDQPLPPEGIKLITEEFHADGVVFDQQGVKVTAFEVDHGKTIKPAFGYRVDYGGRSVTMSGDTTIHPNVIKYGAGTDLLIHEVAMVRRELNDNKTARIIMSHHASPKQAAEVFTKTKPKLAIYTHVLFIAMMNVPPATLDDIIAETKANYDGPFEIGEDLMSFEIGDTVKLNRWTETT